MTMSGVEGTVSLKPEEVSDPGDVLESNPTDRIIFINAEDSSVWPESSRTCGKLEGTCSEGQSRPR